MDNENTAKPKAEKRAVICPCCRQDKKNLILVRPNMPMQVPILPDMTGMTIIPAQVDVINYIVDQYICESCGITFNDIKSKKMTTGAVEARDAKGNILSGPRAKF